MGIIMVLVPYVFYSGFTALIAILSKRSFGRALPVTMCLSGIVIYISQYLFGTFFAGVIGMAIAAGLSVVLACLRRNREQHMVTSVFTAGFAAFTVTYVFAFLLLYKKSFTDWDEFTHWGIMVKESLRLDRFYCVPESRVMWHKDYPPFTCMIEVLWSRLAGWSEWQVTMAMQVFTLSFIIPPFMERLYEDTKICRKNVLKILCTAVSLEIIVLLLEFSLDLWGQRIIHSILPDVLLGVMFAYLCLEVVLREHIDWQSTVALTIVSSSLVLVKQVGIAFFMTALLLLYMKDILMLRRGQLDIRDKKGILTEAVCVPLVTALAYGSWTLYKARYISDTDFSYTNGQFNLRQIDVGEYLGAVTGQTAGIRRDTFFSFIQAILEKPINSIEAFPLTYLSAFILCMAVLVLFYKQMSDQNGRENIVLLAITFCVGTAGYAFMMSVLYLFCFPDGEKEILAGYTRYMDSYVIGEFLILLIVGLRMIHNRNDKLLCSGNLLIASMLLMVLSTTNLRHFAPQALVQNPYVMYRQYADRMRAELPTDSKVFIVYDKEYTTHPQWWGPLQLFTQYYNNGVDISDVYSGAFAMDYNNENIKKQIVDEIRTCDYVYVINTCDNFNQGMAEFYNGAGFTEDTIYQVVTDGDLRLIPID